MNANKLILIWDSQFSLEEIDGWRKRHFALVTYCWIRSDALATWETWFREAFEKSLF